MCWSSRCPSGDVSPSSVVRALKPEEGGVVPAIAVAPPTPVRRYARSRGFQASLRKPLDPWALCRLVSELVTMR